MTSRPLYANEEDVKAKLLIPFLDRLGIDPQEIHCEESFSVKLGRYTYRDDSGKHIDQAGPRLDILVTRNGSNLFVIELKAFQRSLGEEDIKQVASYACLLDEIPPFCLLSNGNETLIIDPITRSVIAPDDLKMPDGYTPTVSEDLRYEALREWIGFSKDNLLVFCRAQVDDVLARLRGSKTDREKKYIPDLYVAPSILAKNYQQFLAHPKPAFVAIGPAGSGKTCFLCHCALDALEKGIPAIFYLASDLPNGLVREIGADLNWALSPDNNEERATRRFFDVFGEESVLVFVDGLDNLEPSVGRQLTNGFLKRVSGKAVRLISSCKQDVWPSLLRDVDGHPTRLDSETYGLNDSPGIGVPELDEREFAEVIRKYRRFYDFSGSIERRALMDGRRNPFLLRVMFEVASGAQKSPITYASAEIFEVYLEKILDRCPDASAAVHTLCSIASTMHQNNTAALSISDVRMALSLRPGEDLPGELFHRSLLVRSREPLTGTVGFYFDRVRDYVIAFHALKLQDKTAEQFSDFAKIQARSGIQWDVLETYYLLAPSQHKRVLDEPMHSNLVDFAEKYEAIIDCSLPDLRERFSGGDGRRIGIAGYIDVSEQRVGAHGFCANDDDDAADRVALFPFSTMPKGGVLSTGSLTDVIGVSNLGWSAAYADFHSQIPSSTIIAHEIEPQLKKLIEKGLLDESQCSGLLCERILAVAHEHLRGFIQILEASSQRLLAPIVLDDIRKATLVKSALHHIEEEKIQNNIRTGKQSVARHGNIVSYVVSWTEEQRRQMLRQARGHVESHPKELLGPLDAAETLLLKDIEDLQNLGHHEINSMPLLPWDNQRFRGGWFWNHWTLETMQECIKRVYSGFLEELPKLVASNFSVLQDSFDCTSKPQPTAFIGYRDLDHDHGPTVVIVTVRGEGDVGPKVQPLTDESLLNGWPERGPIRINGVEYSDWGLCHSGVSGILSAHQTHCPFMVSGWLVPIRGRVYQAIQDALPTVVSQIQSNAATPAGGHLPHVESTCPAEQQVDL